MQMHMLDDAEKFTARFSVFCYHYLDVVVVNHSTSMYLQNNKWSPDNTQLNPGTETFWSGLGIMKVILKIGWRSCGDIIQGYRNDPCVVWCTVHRSTVKYHGINRLYGVQSNTYKQYTLHYISSSTTKYLYEDRYCTPTDRESPPAAASCSPRIVCLPWLWWLVSCPPPPDQPGDQFGDGIGTCLMQLECRVQ